MSNLFEKLTDGDRRTIIRRYDKGDSYQIGKSTVRFKTAVKVRVTQEWSHHYQTWLDAEIDYASAVECTPTQKKLPEARIEQSFWRRLSNWFVTEEGL